jgi:hypothetical protein
LVGAVAWIAFQLQQDEIAPAVLFPLGVGAALGAGEAMIARLIGGPGVRWAVAVTLMAGLLAVVAQDYIGHRHHLRAYAEQIGNSHPLAELVVHHEQPLGPRFDAYLAGKVRSQPLWWGLEAVLTAGAAATAIAWAMQKNQSARAG